MIIELGNHACALESIDDRPKVTTIHIPEADATGLGGYTHKPGLSVDDFRRHVQEADEFRGGVYRLPDNEILLAVRNAWRAHSHDRPAWLQVTPHELTPNGVADDLEGFLHGYFGTDGSRRPLNVEDTHWTPFGEPGQGPPLGPPPITNLYTDDGRVINNVNDGGGQVGTIGVGITTGTDGTHLGVSGNPGAYTGYRIVVYSTTSNNLVWGNITATSSSLVTVDRWYNFATPGGAAGTTPTTPWAFAILDGGFVSTWFVALATGANAPAHGDHSLSTNGNAEYTQASGGYIRKIAPYAQTSGVASRSFTLIPVYTGNGSDTYPQTFTTIGVFCSMVVGTTGTMKFETALNASATVAASGDQVTVTETVTGS